MQSDSASELKARIRADLSAAMRHRLTEEVRVLRTILAAIDDAGAVPVGAMHDKYRVKQFGDASVEVPRKPLSAADLGAVLQAEIDAREAAASECLARGATANAEALRRDAAIVRRYLG